ncbi:MAG: glycosyltransferase family 2 protein [Solobacterium sp.]|nr:glycosyltransferase family 2 protein [Solobacterium sp.]
MTEAENTMMEQTYAYSTPEVSVVVPIYNVADYLPKCLDSIMNQTYSDFEVILVNDGSTDRSPQIAEDYTKKDERFRVLHKENGGLSDARNEGMKQAVGKYICFVDSDDFLEPDMIESCVKSLERYDADMVIFDYNQFYQATNTKEVMRNQFAQGKVYCIADTPELIVGIANAAWNKMYRRSLFTSGNITYPWGCLYEDLGTTYRLLARAQKVVFINRPLYNYLKDRPGNITGEFNMKAYHILDMIKINIDDYKNLGIYERYYEELKYLGGVNLLECLKKTKDCKDKELVSEYIDVCFWFIVRTWPEFPKCRYKITREKFDWIYTDRGSLKLYLKLKQRV